MASVVHQRTTPPLEFLSGGGEMGELMRTHDWANTPLGPVDLWPDSWRTAISICLNSRFPMVLWLGPELVLIYNDACRPMLGASKHPHALGSPGRLVWPEIWDIIGQQLNSVLHRSEATWSDDFLLVLERNNYTEEAYFTYSYSPIKEPDGSVTGVFSAVSENTDRVLSERRLALLRELATRTADSKSVEAACEAFMGTLGSHPDVPFAQLYLADARVTKLQRIATAQCSTDVPIGQDEVSLDGAHTDDPFHLFDVMLQGKALLIEGLPQRVGAVQGEAWPEPVRLLLALPLHKASQATPMGVLVLGVNPRRAFDDRYRSFFDLLVENLATGVVNARAYEAERRRAEILAELDRAKTAFFSNISHEFRTPLTLILGALEETLGAADLPATRRNELGIAHRNSLRLLRLVNTLLDFSRAEAGRLEPSYEPLELAAFTAALADNFRLACERAGLRFDIDCAPLPEAVNVDREMWEKIVFNLVSNAFKFTFEGGIKVRLAAHDGHAILTVADTGTGIPREEQPRIFQSFHRVPDARGRTHEGTGIGLALVKELVGLHGGEVTVESEPGRGSIFTVSIPLSSAQPPAERTAALRRATSTSLQPEVFADEALRSLPDRDDLHEQHEQLPLEYDAGYREGAMDRSRVERRRVLIVDDNADMRDYVARLLRTSHEVVEANDGVEALAAIEAHKPDLVLSDLMMPRLDGFGLLRAIRSDPALADIPVILLSARAGEEAHVEGIEAGADDYLIKPFSTLELLARVNSNLKMAEIRHKALQHARAHEAALRRRTAELETVLQTAPIGVWFTNDPQAVVVTCNRIAAVMLGMSEASQSWQPMPLSRPRTMQLRIFQDGLELPFSELPLQRAVRGKELHDCEFEVRFDDGTSKYLLTNAAPIRDIHGNVLGAVATAVDITERRRAAEAHVANEARLRESEARLRRAHEAGRLGDWTWDIASDTITLSAEFARLLGIPSDSLPTTATAFFSRVLSEDRQRLERDMVPLLTGALDRFETEFRVLRGDGEIRWLAARGEAENRLPDERPVRVVGVNYDITASKHADQQRELLIHELNHRVKNTLASVQSIAMQTLRNTATTSEFHESFVSRLAALSRAHDLLTRGNWQAALLGDIVHQTLEPYGLDSGRIRIEGVAVKVAPTAAVALSMALHELATNAVKYGALSDAHGAVDVEWRIENVNAVKTLSLEWTEHGGPPVEPPRHRGFGSRLIERGIAQELDAEVKLSFDSNGVCCFMRLPASSQLVLS